MAGLLAPLLALAGHCFVGEVAPGSRDTHCFTAVFDGRHVRDVHQVTSGGKTVYQGETLYSLEAGAVTFTYVSSIGGIGRGTASLTPGKWRFDLVMRATPAARPATIATDWQWRGTNAYTVTGGPAPVTYRRVAR